MKKIIISLTIALAASASFSKTKVVNLNCDNLKTDRSESVSIIENGKTIHFSFGTLPSFDVVRVVELNQLLNKNIKNVLNKKYSDIKNEVNLEIKSGGFNFQQVQRLKLVITNLRNNEVTKYDSCNFAVDVKAGI